MIASSRILAAIRESAAQQGLNPYKIAKSSGMPLTTVQRLLKVKVHVPLRNVESLLAALGVEVSLVGKAKKWRRGRII
jgi:DNA-binding IclR family transcriptional regulator